VCMHKRYNSLQYKHYIYIYMWVCIYTHTQIYR
jgi:hypothetical protein